MKKKEKIILIILCPSSLYFLLERWLTKMSIKAWHLISRKHGFLYLFEKGEPKKKEYFIWDSTHTGEAKYSINLRYPSLMKTYGVEKKRSKLNKNSIATFDTIMEVDTNKITEKKLYFKELKCDRNRLYAIRGVRNLFLAIIIIVFFIIALKVR